MSKRFGTDVGYHQLLLSAGITIRFSIPQVELKAKGLGRSLGLLTNLGKSTTVALDPFHLDNSCLNRGAVLEGGVYVDIANLAGRGGCACGFPVRKRVAAVAVGCRQAQSPGAEVLGLVRQTTCDSGHPPKD